MQHTIITSADGSSTLQLTEFTETYHSTNGAYTEAMHIYINAGIESIFINTQTGALHTPTCINIFDIGYGTGLNCIMAYAWQLVLKQANAPYPTIKYYGIEKFPIQYTEAQQLNYTSVIAQHLNLSSNKLETIFRLMHNSPWEQENEITANFFLHKTCADITNIKEEYYKEKGTNPSVIFYDTFSPATQPELWNETIFSTIASGCSTGSVLVTYCSKGTVKQALRSAGFTLERLPGPPGKRHILRATL